MPDHTKAVKPSYPNAEVDKAHRGVVVKITPKAHPHYQAPICIVKSRGFKVKELRS